MPKKIRKTSGRSGNAGDCRFPAFMDEANLDMMTRFGEQFQLNGPGFDPDEFYELKVFEDFLADHVELNRICSVQCMLLWSEWIRTFRRQTSEFPKLILETEFHKAVMGKFGVKIANYDYQGAVYPGIKFVP